MPVPTIRDLAEHLRDETALDMRVCADGEEFVTLENVKVIAFVIRRDDELVEVRQEFDGGEDEFYIESDAIRWARPTAFERTTVKPYRPDGERVPYDDAWSQILFRVAQSEGCATVEDFMVSLVESAKRRYAVLFAAYHTTEWSPLDLCSRLGYKSQTPLLSALWHFKRPDHHSQRERVTRVVEQLWADGLPNSKARRGPSWAMG